MTLTSKHNTQTRVDNSMNTHDKTTNLVVEQLDALNANLPAQTVNELSAIRAKVLQQAQQKSSANNRLSQKINAVFQSLSPSFMLPVGIAAAALLSVLITSQYSNSPAEIPIAMMSTEIPNEELALLENLEFVTWLAEHEQDI